MQKNKIKSLKKIKDRKKLSLKKSRYEHQIKILKKRISCLNKELVEPKSTGNKPVRKPKRIEKAIISYKISSGNLEKDAEILSKSILELHYLAKKFHLNLRYRVKEGCFDVVLDLLRPLGMSLISSGVYDFIKLAIGRLRHIPDVKIRTIPVHYKELRAKEMHKELGRSYKAIVSRESIISDNRTGTKFKIRDKNNMDWAYEIFDNGDDYSHD